MSNVAVLLGIVFGFLLSWMMNEVNLSGLHDASWFAIVTPMLIGMPILDPLHSHSDHDCRVNHRVYRVDGDVPGTG